MRRGFSFLFLAFVVVLCCRTADAGWRESWDRFWLDFHRNNCYPEPFSHADRAAAGAPFAVMINNGWQRQNTLGNHHFDAETQQLTRAGELKLRWILTKTPPMRHSVFVLRGTSIDVTSVRVDSVQQATARIVASGPMPPIFETNVDPPGRPADQIDLIRKKAESEIPDPILPPQSTDSN